MKTIRSILMVVSLGLVSPLMADVIKVGDTDVGDIDLIEAITTKDVGGLAVASISDSTATGCGSGSGDEAETCWAEYHTGLTDMTLGSKEAATAEFVTVNGTASTSIIGFALKDGPGWYIVKNSTNWILMENLSSLDWGVLDLSVLKELTDGDDFNLGNLTISHVSQFDGDSEKVSEPATLGLLGLGLVGIGFARRRRKSI